MNVTAVTPDLRASIVKWTSLNVRLVPVNMVLRAWREWKIILASVGQVPGLYVKYQTFAQSPSSWMDMYSSATVHFQVFLCGLKMQFEGLQSEENHPSTRLAGVGVGGGRSGDVINMCLLWACEALWDSFVMNGEINLQHNFKKSLLIVQFHF